MPGRRRSMPSYTRWTSFRRNGRFSRARRSGLDDRTADLERRQGELDVASCVNWKNQSSARRFVRRRDRSRDGCLRQYNRHVAGRFASGLANIGPSPGDTAAAPVETSQPRAARSIWPRFSVARAITSTAKTIPSEKSRRQGEAGDRQRGDSASITSPTPQPRSGRSQATSGRGGSLSIHDYMSRLLAQESGRFDGPASGGVAGPRGG